MKDKEEVPTFKIHVEEGDSDDPVQHIKNAVQMMRKSMAHIMELNTMNAKIQKAKYDALVKAGFKPEQALFLCK